MSWRRHARHPRGLVFLVRSGGFLSGHSRLGARRWHWSVEGTQLDWERSDADYFDCTRIRTRTRYREEFDELFAELLDEGLLTRTIPDIVNSNLFKYSPFKALNQDQAVAVDSVLDIFLHRLGGWPGQKPCGAGGPRNRENPIQSHDLPSASGVHRAGWKGFLQPLAEPNLIPAEG